MAVNKLYPDVCPMSLKRHYTDHITAMTRERLDGKSEIAVQLAWRDQRIARLRNALIDIIEFGHADCCLEVAIDCLREDDQQWSRDD